VSGGISDVKVEGSTRRTESSRVSYGYTAMKVFVLSQTMLKTEVLLFAQHILSSEKDSKGHLNKDW